MYTSSISHNINIPMTALRITNKSSIDYVIDFINFEKFINFHVTFTKVNNLGNFQIMRFYK